MPPETQAPTAEVPAETPLAAPAEGQSQTVEVPLDSIAGAKEGDTVQFKVVSLDEQNGIATLAPVGAEAPESAGGSDDMAAEFSPNQLQKGS